jgi:hypothetical protein
MTPPSFAPFVRIADGLFEGVCMNIKFASGLATTLLSLGFSGCASVPLTQSGAISSYANLGPESGRLGKARTFVDSATVATAITVAIEPTVITPAAASFAASEENASLVANAVNRTMCISLSDRFLVVRHGQPADLSVRATVTSLVPTDKVAAGVSKVATLGTAAVLPVGVPRLPWGLGGIAIEAEAIDRHGTQRAAIAWSRGANSITNSARISEIGDAYGLAGDFGRQFGRMLVKAKADPSIGLPSAERIGTAIGAAPSQAACEDFGRSPGITGIAASVVGAPPSWADKAKN